MPLAQYQQKIKHSSKGANAISPNNTQSESKWTFPTNFVINITPIEKNTEIPSQSQHLLTRCVEINHSVKATVKIPAILAPTTKSGDDNFELKKRQPRYPINSHD